MRLHGVVFCIKRVTKEISKCLYFVWRALRANIASYKRFLYRRDGMVGFVFAGIDYHQVLMSHLLGMWLFGLRRGLARFR
jgi:hypothetical protein